MKHNPNNSLVAAVTLAGFAVAVTSARAADLTWDTVAGDGTSITAGSGSWNTTAGNVVWNDGTIPNMAWTQTDTITPLNAAIFAGADGTVDNYVVTLPSSSQMAAQSLTFNSSGYKITGTSSVVYLGIPGTTPANGSITVADGKTATISSTLGYLHNRSATIAVGSGGVLNLGGGTQGTARPQWNNFSGAGTVNFIGGTFQNTIGSLNMASINLTAGAHTMIDQGTNLTTAIGNNAGRDVTYTVSGTGALNVGANNTATTTYTLSLGRSMGDFKSTLTLQSGGTVNVGVTTDRAGQINLGSFDGDGNSRLDVQGGTLTVGTGKATNKLYFFAAGANAGKTATMTQSGGTAIFNGIQFGANTGDTAGGLNGANGYDGTALATLQLSGSGNLYVGAQGITRGTAAASLPVTIQLQGGTLGGAQNWSSSLDMKLTAATIRAQDGGSNARNITLSGSLSNDGAVNGTLTKTGLGTLTLSGANTYTGATTISAGMLQFAKRASLYNNTPTSWTAANIVVTSGGTLGLNVGGTGEFTTSDVTTLLANLGGVNGTGTAGFAGGSSIAFDTTNASGGTFGVADVIANSTAGGGGAIGLTKLGANALVLTNANNYTGGTVISGGTLTLRNSGAGLAQTLGILTMAGPDVVLRSDNGGSGTLSTTFGSLTTRTAGNTANIVSTGGTNGTDNLVKLTTGAAGFIDRGVFFNGADYAALDSTGYVRALAYGSDTNSEAAGTITASKHVKLTATPVSRAGDTLLSLNLAGGGVDYTMSSGTLTVPGILKSGGGSVSTISGGTAVTGGTGIELVIRTDTASDLLTIGTPVAGTGALTKSGAGMLKFTSSTNSYTGATNVSGGTLQLSGGGRLGSGTYAGAILIADGATFDYASSASQTLSGAITGAGGTVKLSANVDLTLSNAGNGYGTLGVGDGRGFISNAGALPSAATVNISGGLLVFSTGTSYGSTITVANGGGIATRNSTGTSLTGTVTLPGSGTVIFNNDGSQTYGLSIASGQTLTGNLAVQIGGSRTTTSAVGGVTLSGKLTGLGALTVASSGQVGQPTFGTGVLTLTGANDHTGGTTLNQGTLTIGTGGTLGATTGALAVGNNNTTAAGTNSILNLATAVDTIVGSLSGTIATPASGTNTTTINTGGTGRTFTVNQTSDGTYAGVIAGGGNFTLGGGSTHALTLSGTNTYTGATTVAAGSLIINGAVASTSVVVNGSLGGSGVMANATLSGSGSINPGSSPGILTVAATNPTSGLDYNFEFTAANTLPTWNAPSASVNDVMRLTDATSPITAALDGTNTVTIYLNVASITEGNVFTGGFYTDKNVSFLSSISSGAFQYLLANASGAVTYNGLKYDTYSGPLTFDVTTVSQTADFGAGAVTGFTTQFTVVPEPSVASLLGGLGLLSFVRRRKS